jgi:hypothetical protein
MMTFKGNICHPTALAFFSQQAFGQFSLAADNGKRRDFIGSSAFSVKSR